MLSNEDDREGDGAMGTGDGSKLVGVGRPVDAYRFD